MATRAVRRALGLAVLLLAGPAVGGTAVASPPPPPSLDCAAPVGGVEQMICGGCDLRRRHDALEAQYRDAARGLPETSRAVLAHDQHAWLRGRDRCLHAHDASACLRDVYAERAARLGTLG